MVALNFDASAVSGVLLEPGQYEAQIISAEPVQSQNNPANSYLQCNIKIEGKADTIVDRLNLWNQSETAKEMANKTLAEIANALGMRTIPDSDDMLLRPLMVQVEIEVGDLKPDGSKYPDKNVIGRYMPIGAAPTPQAAPATLQAAWQAAQAPAAPTPQAPSVPPAAPTPATSPSPAPVAAVPVWEQQ